MRSEVIWKKDRMYSFLSRDCMEILMSTALPLSLRNWLMLMKFSILTVHIMKMAIMRCRWMVVSFEKTAAVRR
jgi:hypothetical protein